MCVSTKTENSKLESNNLNEVLLVSGIFKQEISAGMGKSQIHLTFSHSGTFLLWDMCHNPNTAVTFNLTESVQHADIALGVSRGLVGNVWRKEPQ